MTSVPAPCRLRKASFQIPELVRVVGLRSGAGTFETPKWDQKSQKAAGDALLTLDATILGFKGA
ncbi:hypothetical protein SAMN05216228_102651 [Rhizobium tibeticum]|uniref:Uncharacterized protein n=1 Tax=Rhizobium tibeticum TaxID=501024 RepID=A0A1H8SVZ7_9HYPH|nr:hypothetical protein [Rhizobium tibeticum]SEI13611.1 hypothetical protein RTCCBAU85039_4963 [Rhizobium tibeticum]SEO82646.1 hypothetical protein SAMN05216228_102651 [Rhizobium tibeticum]